VLGSASRPDAAAPVRARIAEIERGIADTQRRLRNQVLALEDKQVTTPARRRISDRIAELEQQLSVQHASLDKLRADLDATPPDAPALAELLDRLPVFGQRLGESPKADLRRLFEAWT
jgi:uncharacterized coiled-coil protein SlyX